jgi:phosphoglycolate phosphatase
MPALLFDLDGTLADTKPDLHAAMNYVLTKNGLAEVPDDAITNMIGGGAREIIKRGLHENGASWDDAKLDAATEEFVLWYDQNIDAHTKIYPNLLPVLQAAQAAHIKMAVVTNKRESLSAKLLFRLGLHGYFDVLVGGDTLPKRKPDPDTIELALAQLGVPPQEAIMVGDSEADTGGAMAANVATICVSFGYRRVSLEDLKADAIIDDYAEFAAAAKKLKPGMLDAL